MRIAIMGAGGVGSWLGARLAAAGADPVLIARGAHLQAMQRDGLALDGPPGALRVPRIAACGDPAAVGRVDVVVLTVKLYDVAAACAAIAPMLGPRTAVIGVQNGVAMPGWLPALVGTERAVSGLVFVSATVPEPGRVRHLGRTQRLVVGALDGRTDDRLERIAAAVAAADIDVAVVPDIERHLWEKFLFLASASAIGCLGRQPIGAIQTDADARAAFVEAMTEIATLARAKGITLAADIVPRTLALAETFDPAARMSMLEDLEAGRRLEIGWLSGAVVAMGAALGIPTPVHRTAYACLKHAADGRKAGEADTRSPATPAPGR